MADKKATAENKTTADIILISRDHTKTRDIVSSITNEDAYLNKQLTVYWMDTLGAAPPFSMEPMVHYYDVSDKSDAEILNYALSMASSDYITFQTVQGIYKDGAITKALSHGGDILSLHPFGTDADGKRFSYSDIPVSYVNDIAEINLTVFPKKFHTCFSAYFFKRDILADVRFDTDMEYDYETKELLNVLDRRLSYTLINKPFEYTSPDENDYFNYLPQFEKSWYLESMDKFLISAVKEASSKFCQHFVLYLIACRYACNMNERDKTILSPAEAEEFIKKTGKAIRYIDDTVLADNEPNGIARLPKFFALNLLRMKYDDEKLMPRLVTCGNNIDAYYGDSLIWKLSSTKIEVKVTYFDGENLTMDGFFPGSYVFNDDEIEIVALLDKTKEYKVRRNHIYALNKFFNLSAKGNYSFHFSIPESMMHDKMNISFCLKYKGCYYPLAVTFIRAMTKISNFYGTYFAFGKHILIYQNKPKHFLIENLTKKNHLRHELIMLKQIAKDTKGMWRLKMVGNRLLYWITKPFYKKKKIWLTMDKLFKAGDNGEYFYRYVKKQNPKGIKIYYVVQADSPDYKRLKREFNTIVKFNSLHHKMLALHTDLMLATHVDTLNCNGYYKATQKYFKDLYSARVVCLAHGLTIQKIAQYQNRVFDNTVLYFFASKYEVENVSHEIYDYYDKEALQLTGHARYDGLISNDKKIILITPTWRRGITTGKAKKGSTYSHSDSFKSSEYYKIYNGLISDERLIASAKKNGYRIVYLLHPAMSAQLSDFEASENVEIVAATGDISYEKILTESSLMVTDYSGVQFDFAYMKKPLVYYHPDTLPPQYEAGGLVYETMGFGPICTNHESIINSLCGYMDKNCKMEEIYKQRVDDFFKYNDHNNCERIYEQVMKFQKKFGKVNEF